MADRERRDLARVFNEVAELYGRVRPGYPAELIADLVAIAGLDGRDVREPLLDAIAERIRTRTGDRAARRYLSVLRVAQRVG